MYESALYFVLFSLAVSIVAGIRVAARGGPYNSLIGVSVVILAIATILVILGEVYTIQFSRDIALYLLLLATVGTLLLSKIIKGGGV